MSQNEPLVVVEDVPTMEDVGSSLKSMKPARKKSAPPSGIMERLKDRFRSEKGRISRELDQFLKMARREPANTKVRVKIAEMYQKMGEPEKAIAEYLKTAEIFSKKDLWPQAMAVYKRILKLDPAQEEVSRCVSEIYHRLGFLGDAFSQYNVLLQHYHNSGDAEKSLEILALMADLNPQKFALDKKAQVSREEAEPEDVGFDPNVQTETLDLEIPTSETSKSFFDLCAELQKKAPRNKHLKIAKEICTEKIFGFDEIMKELQDVGGTSRVYPNFNFQMGVACREMGFHDEAIEQFQVAMKKGQNPLEAAHFMGLCYREKGWWEEARHSFRRALQMELVPEEKRQIIQKDLDLLPQEHLLENEGLAESVTEGTEESLAENLEEDSSQTDRSKRKKRAVREGVWV
ncbi:MAG: repeat-containing protein [Deltaproteobacteria bacterium]|jgi:tetratricopeptide (TPR) repeat protein|nr:repeat-containing protein [Deltaproteobacteria bacterium]